MSLRLSFCTGGGIVLLASCVLLCGCSGESSDKWTKQRPNVVPAGGRVLYNGNPVEGADVAFTSESGLQGAIGKTDENGQFQLTTFAPGDGAVPGEHQVKISKVEVSSEWTPDAGEDVRPQVEQRSLLPARYGEYATSGLTASVSEAGTNDFTFELMD